jgi:hypothetical protein
LRLSPCCLQVRKLMVKLEQQQQQEDSDSSDSDDCTNRLLKSVIQVLSTTAVYQRNEHINTAWQELARPTAAVFEHFMHVQLLQHGARMTDLTVSTLWHTFRSFLWSNSDNYGPLLMVAVDETTEEAAATLAGTAAAAPAASEAEASASTAAAAAAACRSDLTATGAPPPTSPPAAAALLSAPQLFSLCISAVKLLRQQVHDPYAAMDCQEDRLQFTAASILEYVQQAAAAMITGTAPSEALIGQERSFRSWAAGLPWAVLLLRCVQLGLQWLQQAVVQLLSEVQSSSGSSPDAEQQQQQAWGDAEQQELLGNAVASLGQLEDRLYVLGLVLGKWCALPAAAAADGASSAEQPAAAVLLPLLQKQQLQLQQQLLPAVQQVLQLWEAGVCRDSDEGRLESIADATRSRGILSRWHFSTQRLTYDLFSKAGDPESKAERDDETNSVSSFEADVTQLVAEGIWDSTLQQQQAAVRALQQLLGSGKLQAWLAAASSALPLRWCCNNPGCSNLGTAGSKARGSELRRVAARQCSGCQSACYCQKVRCSTLLSMRALIEESADADEAWQLLMCMYAGSHAR